LALVWQIHLLPEFGAENVMMPLLIAAFPRKAAQPRQPSWKNRAAGAPNCR
jgi:hypothetical protein